MPIMVPPSSPAGTLQYYWKDPNGLIRDLNHDTSPHIFIPTGSLGLGNSGIDIADDKLPNDPGTIIRHMNTKARKLEIPIVIHTPSLAELAITIEDLYSWFETGDENSRTPGYFQVIRPDGTTRQIAAYYTGGLEGDTKEGAPNWTRVVVSLYCPDPYPTEINLTSVDKTVAQAASFTIINQGRLEAYPIWTIHGPFTGSVTVNNSTITQGFVANLNLNSSQYVIVDTRPSELRQGLPVYDNLGNNILYIITPTSIFWTLAPGNNAIQVTFAGGTSGVTNVHLDYTARYRSLFR